MLWDAISDWDDAYANGPNIPDGGSWPAAWVEPAATWRQAQQARGLARLDLAYGSRPRNRLDLFLPAGPPLGLVVFVHGGFWLRLDKSYWSHLAGGAVAGGHAVAVPSYTLCPEMDIAGIVAEIAAAISHAASLVQGPLRLVGHSAGGQLVTRMAAVPSPLPPAVQARLAGILSISGLHDLRPLLQTAMNAELRLDAAAAAAASPALLEPLPGTRLICWVGGAERAEFRRQSALLANIWRGLGAMTAAVEAPDRHHFDVIDGLAEPGHLLTRTLLAG